MNIEDNTRSSRRTTAGQAKENAMDPPIKSDQLSINYISSSGSRGFGALA